MQTDTRERLGNRLKRIAGQVAGLQKMVEEDRYCVDVLTQVAAVRSALDSLGLELLSDHVEHCVVGHAEGNGHGKAKVRSKDELINEIRQTLERFLR
jgi:CsoR family transcriptional regulator, copper-sensing transcriptional repressor